MKIFDWFQISNISEHIPLYYSDRDTVLEKIKMRDASEYVNIVGKYDDSCYLYIDPNNFKDGRKPKIVSNSKDTLYNINFCLIKATESQIFNTRGNNNNVFVGRFGASLKLTASIYYNSTLVIGDKTTANSLEIISDNSDIIIGSDCMFSHDVVIQGADQHGIIDASTGNIINGDRQKTVIGDHVWVAKRAMVMRGANIGSGSIIAAGALVAKNFDPLTLAGGVPAKSIRSGVTWSRNPRSMSDDERKIIADIQSKI